MKKKLTNNKFLVSLYYIYLKELNKMNTIVRVERREETNRTVGCLTIV